MKLFLFFILAVIVSQDSSADELRQAYEIERISYWEGELSRLEKLEELPDEQEVRELAKVLRGAGIPEHYRYAEKEARKLREVVTVKILSISGHSKMLRDYLETIRSSGDRALYNQVREQYLIEVFPFLPSLETFEVLSEYVLDDRDPPSEIGSDYISLPPNSILAACALSNIGLRNAPSRPAPAWISLLFEPDLKSCVADYRSWCEEVKDGKRAVSFVGQKIEHRFKPDGTWAAIPLAFDDKSLREELKPSVLPTSAATLPPAESTVPTSAISTRWLWVAGPAALLIAVVTWLARKLKR